MNLYQLHSDPESLHKHDEAHNNVPKLFWEKYKNNSAELKKREDSISKDVEYSFYSYWYARDVLDGPFPKGEEAISKDPQYSYLYAKNILKNILNKF